MQSCYVTFSLLTTCRTSSLLVKYVSEGNFRRGAEIYFLGAGIAKERSGVLGGGGWLDMGRERTARDRI